MNYIIDLKQLQKRNHQSRKIEPEYLRKSTARFKALLAQVGYERRNPELHDALCRYAGMLSTKATVKGLALLGALGIGKSWGTEALAHFTRTKFVTASELVTAYEQGGVSELLEVAIPLKLGFESDPEDLIIDEVGREPQSATHYGTKLNVIEEVLRRRYIQWERHGARTIITSNAFLRRDPRQLDKPSIESLYGDDIADRVQQMCNIPQIGGCDLRQ
ncbi:MAG: hypothetical protein GY750_05115 [Lentisphaerae bacterium]|nr:hypothetical protein [Lentisphaerota bacterium]MCP4100793.1 hypothetical protein [Lentisphaerota bacterium]